MVTYIQIHSMLFLKKRLKDGILYVTVNYSGFRMKI